MIMRMRPPCGPGKLRGLTVQPDALSFQVLRSVHPFLEPARRPMSDLHDRYNEVEKLIDTEQYDDAAKGLQEIVAADDSFVLAHLALARVYTKTGEHDKAIQHGERAVELEPDDAFNHTALSVTYQRAWAGTQDQQYIQKAEDAMARAHSLG